MCVRRKDFRSQTSLAFTQEVGVPDGGCGMRHIVIGTDGKREEEREKRGKPTDRSVRCGFVSHGYAKARRNQAIVIISLAASEKRADVDSSEATCTDDSQDLRLLSV